MAAPWLDPYASLADVGTWAPNVTNYTCPNCRAIYDDVASMCVPESNMTADVAECLNDGEGIFCSYLVLYKCDLGNHPAALVLLVPWLITALNQGSGEIKKQQLIGMGFREPIETVTYERLSAFQYVNQSIGSHAAPPTRGSPSWKTAPRCSPSVAAYPSVAPRSAASPSARR